MCACVCVRVCEFPGDEEERGLFPHQLTTLCVSY